MFCTSKERETCDVEKMTCEGCYYNKDGDYMNEEEIKNGIELLKKSVDDNHKISEHCYYFDDYQMSKLRQETFKLADALNQEKEKNKKLEEEKQQFVNGYTETMDKLGDCVINSYNQEKIYEKVINRMAKQISCLSRNLDNATNFERISEEEYDVDFIKQYYFKKARGEENEKS